MTEKIRLYEAIEILLKKFKENKEYDYKNIQSEIDKIEEKLDKLDYCLLSKWAKINFRKWKNNKWTFWANFIDLIRSWFFFETKNIMWSFAEQVINDIADCERKKICKDIMCNQFELPEECKKWECLDVIKQKIWDEFLKDNLLYFKKSDAEDRNWWDSWKDS